MPNEVGVLNTFNQINFSELDQAIQTIAKSSCKLSDEEKKSANEIIDRWEQEIVENLQEKKNEATDCLAFISCIKSGFYNMYKHKDLLETICEACGLIDDLEDMEKAYDDLNAIEIPSSPSQNLNDTYEDYLKKQQEYQLAFAISSEVRKNKTDICNKKKQDLLKKLVEMPQIKELEARVKKFNRNVSSLTHDCIRKSQYAKLCVSINSDDVRNALKKLIDFKIV